MSYNSIILCYINPASMCLHYLRFLYCLTFTFYLLFRSRARDDSEADDEITIGTAVEADYKGKGKYFGGKVSRMRANGTFDIDYDDGEKEMGVPKSAIRVKAKYVLSFILFL